MLKDRILAHLADCLGQHYTTSGHNFSVLIEANSQYLYNIDAAAAADDDDVL